MSDSVGFLHKQAGTMVVLVVHYNATIVEVVYNHLYNGQISPHFSHLPHPILFTHHTHTKTAGIHTTIPRHSLLFTIGIFVPAHVTHCKEMEAHQYTGFIHQG